MTLFVLLDEQLEEMRQEMQDLEKECRRAFGKAETARLRIKEIVTEAFTVRESL